MEQGKNSIFDRLNSHNLLKIDVIQTKGENNTCNGKVWWQNEHILDVNLASQDYKSGLNLYCAGDYHTLVNGHVRNLTYTKK